MHDDSVFACPSNELAAGPSAPAHTIESTEQWHRYSWGVGWNKAGACHPERGLEVEHKGATSRDSFPKGPPIQRGLCGGWMREMTQMEIIVG